ncbi:ketopantoate reductase family protein [Pseudoalteromonas sp. ZZD1]|uniref:ketopantoate reductase family protein n=1 Tax=Pseudoalteromonas sp. ZZD1 TaxID=3139395 RepID=UPI003BAB0331
MDNIVIVGDGAIGLLYSHFLSANNHISLISRKAKVINQYYYQDSDKSKIINVNVLSNKKLEQLKPIDTVIFAVKAYQVNEALAQLLPYLSPSCQLVLSHNGMSDLQPILTKLQNQHALYFLTTRLAGFKADPNTVVHTGDGESILGSCNDIATQGLPYIVKQLSAIPSIRHSDKIALIRWQKLLINIAINPLSAHYNVKNGELTAPRFSTEVFNLLSESCFIANKLGININLADTLATAYQVMADTAFNYSSMQQDITYNRPTEIDAMCGYICQQGAKVGVKTPYNQYFLDMIRHKKSAN